MIPPILRPRVASVHCNSLTPSRQQLFGMLYGFGFEEMAIATSDRPPQSVGFSAPQQCSYKTFYLKTILDNVGSKEHN